MRFIMKPLKTENEVGSSMKTTTKYAFIAPGAIGKGRGRGGLRSLIGKENMPTKSLFPQSSDIVKQYIQEIETNAIEKGRGQGLKNSTISSSQGIGMIHKNYMVLEKEYMESDSPLPPSTDQLAQYTQKIETSVAGKGRRQGLKNSTMSACHGMGTIHKNSTVLDKEYMQVDSLLPPSTDQVNQCTQKFETSSIGKGREKTPSSLCSSLGVSENEMEPFHQSVIYANQHMHTPSKTTRSYPAMSSGQGMRPMDKNPLILEKEHMQTDISLPPSTDQVMQHSQTQVKQV
ncbi:uncharacterized protein LOC132042149 isoform X4 [Lycium ferocissimum]|uniref:uncharacterized protein LOC132042149 isoform X4 n=1 Tax=Lycium ferocissimum TaxID=112874 RepID=UPI0028156AFF|nr:uncharacterized protein LOC132042149 isoform X4 [Lycium ferocissimum]